MENISYFAFMNQSLLCHKCGKSSSEWGKDPMGVICNHCFTKMENQKEVMTLSMKALCVNCLYWISADQTYGRCRNSHSEMFNTFTPVSESCRQFLTID